MRLFVWLGSLLVLTLLAALVVPPFFDWDRFRTSFETEASRVLGQPVKVGGGTTARLLPLPSVTFSDIRVGAGKEPMLTAESFHVNVELAPLLKGDVVIVDMSLTAPKLDVRIAQDGTMDWSLRRGNTAMIVSAEDVAVENISLTDGVVRVRDERFEREFIVRNIDANAEARTLAGPWRGDARFSYLGQRVKLEGSTGRLKADGSISLSGTLKPQKLPYDISFDGPFSAKDGIPSASGIVTVKPVSRQSDSERINFPRDGIGDALPVRFEGDLEVGSAGASVPAFRMEVGLGDDPYALIGSGQAVFGEELSFRAKVEGQQIDVSRLRDADEKTAAAETGDGKDLASRINILTGLLRRIPQFEATGDVDLKLPAVIAGDTVIREITLNMRPLQDASGWRLQNVKAQLPGRTEFRADGALTLGESPAWKGALILASKQPSGLAKWLAARIDPVIRGMNGAGFSANAVVDATKTELNDLEIALDDAQLKGRLLRRSPEKGRPQLSAQLSGDRAELDQLAALFRLFSGETEGTSIAGTDIDVKLDVGELALKGFRASDVSGAVVAVNDTLSVNDLKIGDLEGASIAAQAMFDDFPRSLRGVATGTFEAENPVVLLKKLAARTGRFNLPRHLIDNPELLSGTRISIDLKPESDQARVTVQGEAGGSSVDLKLVSDDLTQPVVDQNLDGTLILVNDNAAALMAQLGVSVVPGDTGGRAAFRGVVNGTPADGASIQAALTLASGYVSASGNLNDQLTGSLKFRSEIEDFDPLILLTGLAVPRFGQGISGEFSGAVDLDKSLIRLNSLEGKLGESDFTATLELAPHSTPRPMLKGNIKADSASVDVITSTVFSQAAQRNARLFSGLDAEINVSADKVELQAGVPQQIGDLEAARARLLVLDGDMVFDDLEARLAGGRLTGRVSLGQTAARSAGGQLALVGADARQLATLVSPQPWIAGDASMSLSFESTGENAEGLISGLTGSGTIAVKNGTLFGLNEGALKPVLMAADALDDDELTEKISEFINPNVRNGTFDFAKGQAAFSIASGVVRASNVRLENERASLGADLSHDLGTGSSDVEMTVAYEAGRESVVAASPEFSLRVVGKPEEHTVTTDVVAFSTYLGLRLSERKQREFEAQKASILERQRLLRTARLYTLKEEKRRLLKEEQERIEQLRREEDERRRLEQIRRAREALEQAKLEADLKAAEQRAEAEAKAEAGRRAKRQEQIELLRRRAEQEARKRKNASDAELLDFNKLDGG